MNEFLACLFAVVLAIVFFFLEYWPRIKNVYFGIDTWRFTLLADFIRTHKKMPDCLPNHYLVPGSTDNPPLLPFFLSRFPKDWLDKNQGVICPAIDIINSLMIFWLGWMASGRPEGGLLAQTFYGLTPVVPLEASNLSLRTPGALVFNAAMIFSQNYVMHPSFWSMIPAVAAIVVVAYTHRMTLQVFFIALLSFAIASGDVNYLIIFFSGLAVAIFAFKGQYLRYLRGQLLMICFWMYNIENRLAHQIRGNPSKTKKHTDFVRRIEYMIWKIPFFPFLAINPWMNFIFLYLGWKYLGAGEGIQTQWFTVTLEWSVILFILGLIFNLKHLRFLGEGQRYLEYGTAATAAAVATIVLRGAGDGGSWQIPVATLVGGVCLCLILFFQFKLVLKNPDKSVTPALWDIIHYLNADPEETRIACLPHGLADALAYFLSNGRVLLSDNSVGVYELGDYWPLLKRPLIEIADKYALNYFLVSEKYVTLAEIDLPGFELVFERENYKLLKRTAEAA